jgi:hypothetical protein
MAGAADVFSSWEGTASQYVGRLRKGESPKRFSKPTWAAPADRLWHIVYDTPAELVDEVVALSKARGAGWLFITDDAGDWEKGQNPFNDFPDSTYWASFEQALAKPAATVP